MRLFSLFFGTSLLRLCHCGGLDSCEVELLNTLANSPRKPDVQIDPMPQGEPIQLEQNHKGNLRRDQTPEIIPEPTAKIKLESNDSFQQPLAVVVPQPDRLSTQITRLLEEQMVESIKAPKKSLAQSAVDDHRSQQTDQPQEPTFAVTLDLAHSDNPAIDVQTVVTDDGVKSTYYYQLGKIFFDEVRDGQEEIWDSTDGKKCIMAHTITRAGRMHLSLLVKSGHTTSFVEYEKALDGMWREVEKRLEESRPITLDISHPYHFAFAIDELMEDRMVINRYVPQNGYAIKEVMDGSAILWKAHNDGHNDQECILAMVRFDGTVAPILAYLVLQTGDTTMELRLRRMGGKWTQVEKNEYDATLAEMRDASLLKQRVELDVTIMMPRMGHYGVKMENHSGMNEYGRKREEEHVDGTGDEVPSDLESDLGSGYTREDATVNTQVQRMISPSSSPLSDPSTPPIPSTPITLDLSSPDPSKIKFVEEEGFKLTFHRYSPHDGYYISSIVDNDKEVWKGAEDEKCVHAESSVLGDFVFFAIEVNNGAENIVIGFKRVSGNWRETSRNPMVAEEGRESLWGSSVSYSDGHTGCVLDLAHPNEAKIKVRITEDGGVRSKRFFRNGDSFMSSVMDNGKEIWRASEREECKGVTLFSKGKTTLLMLRIITSGWPKRELLKTVNEKWYKIVGGEHIPKFFVKNGREWVALTQPDFNERVKEMTGGSTELYEPSTPSQKVTLKRLKLWKAAEVCVDSTTPDADTIIIKETEDGGVLCKDYYLRDGSYVTSVIDNGTTLWGAGQGERCMFIGSCISGDIVLLTIKINKSEENFQYKFFEKNGSAWHEITRSETERRVVEMTGVAPKQTAAYVPEDEGMPNPEPFERPSPTSTTISHEDVKLSKFRLLIKGGS